MGSELLSFTRMLFAEGSLVAPNGSKEDRDALAKLISDVMTSWWAQAVAIGLFAVIALLVFRASRREDGGGQPADRRRATIVSAGFLVILGAIVALAATNRQPAMILLEYLVLWTSLLVLIARNLAPAVLGIGDAVMWALSPRRRREMREAAGVRAGARERGAVLEQALDEALDDRHGADKLRRGVAPPWG